MKGVLLLLCGAALALCVAALLDVAGVWDNFVCNPDVIDAMKDGACH